MLPEKLREAITLVRAGDKDTARKLLMDILENDPTNETAWLWFVDTLESDREKIIALKGLLKINPKSQAAHLGLKRLTGELPEEVVPEEGLAPEENPQSEPEPPAPPETLPVQPPVHKARRFEKQWLVIMLMVAGAVTLLGIIAFLFAGQLGLLAPSKSAECTCVETDAYLVRVQDRVSRWVNNQAIYEIAEKNGDAPSNTDYAQQIYQDEMDDRVPVCLKDLHDMLLIAFEYHVKYGEALRSKNKTEIDYYRKFVISTREQLQQDFAVISANLKCTE